MKFRAFLILLLMAMVVAAPVVDATICEDCNHAAPAAGQSQRPADDAGQQQLSSGYAGSAVPSTGDAQDLCPFCSGSIAAVTSLVCGAPFTHSHTLNLPKLLALSNLSKSITKPPQN